MSRATIYRRKNDKANRIFVKIRSLQGEQHLLKTPFFFIKGEVPEVVVTRLRLFIERTFFSGSVEKHSLKDSPKNFEFTGKYQSFNGL